MSQIVILLTVLFSLKTPSANNADIIMGKWINIPKENLIIEVYKLNNEYKGKINWAKDNDKKKPVGFIILDKLKYNAKSDIWENGKIHDPNTGRTYSATAKIKNDGTLEVLGYIGIKLFGTKKYFKRVK